MSYLVGENMTGGYGGADIIIDCTIGVERGEIAVIVGPNGAGKSTAMKALLGMLDLREGQVSLDGRDITVKSPQARVELGMAFVPQTANVFVSMSVEENLEMGAYLRRDDIGMVEQNARQALAIADRGYVLVVGKNRHTDTGEALLADPQVRKSFLGG